MKESTIKLSQSLRAIAQALDGGIEEVCGERIAFTLIVFTEGRASYISTATREDSVREIKVLLEHWEKGMPDVPAHKVQ
jgi:hypothetical protein